jgi:hypothetical protein
VTLRRSGPAADGAAARAGGNRAYGDAHSDTTIAPTVATRATWGHRPNADPPRPKMRLLHWHGVGKGALRGRAKVRLPGGLEISDIAIFSKNGRIWAQLPAHAMRDAEGRALTDDRGKTRYSSPIRWSTKALQDRFSEAVIAIIRAERPGAIPGEAG